MKLNLFIGSNEIHQYVDIHAPELNDQVQAVIDTVNNINSLTTLNGYKDQEIYLLNISDIITFRVIDKRVTAFTQYDSFTLKERLYILENQLPHYFIRISKSEIVNQYCIEKLQLEPNGLIRMYLKHLTFTYSSRRYLKSIKERLSL